VIPVQANNASFVDQLNWHSNRATSALARISSGQKLLAPQDDAAGLAVASRMEAQLMQLNATANNLSSAVSYTQTQAGYLAGAQRVLDRMGELAIRAQDGTLSDEMRSLYNTEFRALKETFNDARTAKYNEADLFNGSAQNVAISPENGSILIGEVDLFTADINAVTATETEVNTLANAADALKIIREAGDQLAQHHAGTGSVLSELRMASEQIATARATTTESLSRIQDANIAEETAEFTREAILTQSSVFALQQANAPRAHLLNLLS